MIPFDTLPLWSLISIFGLAALLVWGVGTRLAFYATEIAQRTGISGAVVGLVLLGFITSLPEVATAGTAAIGGNADLAVNNLLGGVSFQIVVLAAATSSRSAFSGAPFTYSPSCILGAPNIETLWRQPDVPMR